MANIKDIIAREILDSRGNPTIEVDMFIDNGVKERASVPSGASTGLREALELRDGDLERYNGRGVLKAVNNINTVIKDNLIGMPLNQKMVDKALIELDGTKTKSNLGANAILGVSLASLKCLAKTYNKELYEYITNGNMALPIPMMNLINGGEHASNNLDIQEFMIVPTLDTWSERLRAGAEIFHTLKQILKDMNLSTNVGDEGGFAPELKNNEEALELLVKAINESGYKAGENVFIALDVAASSMYNEKTKTYSLDNKDISAEELTYYYQFIASKYPISSIEDPFYEEDFESLANLTKLLGDKIMIVGDDFFVTNEEYLQKAIDMKAGNAILLKANQIGTITEMTNTLLLAKKNDFKTVISHRSGETEDTFIADLAVGLNIPYIKTGALSRGERICKYNQLLRIEEKLTKK